VSNLKQLKKQMQEMFGDGDAQIGGGQQAARIEAKSDEDAK
jgi:heat-inducible transcriptional repressor